MGLFSWVACMVALCNMAWARVWAPPITLKSAVITFHKDEAELLSDWIGYNAGIFGFGSLYIIDHRSSSPAIQNLLAFAVAMGAHVIPFNGSLEAKGEEVTRVIHEIIANDPDVSTLIPLDTDEFIVAEQGGNNTFTTSPAVILDHIDKLPRDGFQYQFSHIKAAMCSETEVAFDGSHQRRAMTAMYFGAVRNGKNFKKFFDRHVFIQTDHGNHVGIVEADSRCDAVLQGEIQGVDFIHDQCFHKTPLAIVHYGISALSYKSWVRKMHMGAAEMGFNISSACVGIGSHYCMALQAIDRDPEGSEHCNRNCNEKGMQLYYSPFVASALIGNRQVVLKYSSAPKWEGSCG